MKHTAVRVALTNGSWYPAMVVTYEQDDDGHGYEGECTTWPDAEAPSCKHTLSLRQGVPLGAITVMLDPGKAGCWAQGELAGAGLDERDLLWAALWAVQAIKDRHGRRGDCST